MKKIHVLIYGEPGIGKTSITETLNNTVILDFNRGIHRSGLKSNVDVYDMGYEFIMNNYKEFVAELKNYDNIVIDTIDDFLSQIRDHNKQKNNYSRNKFKEWTDLKDAAIQFYTMLSNQNCNVIDIAHAKEVDENNVKIKRPLIQGSTFDYLIGKADLVGLYTIQNERRTLNFNPSEFHYGKNSAGIETIEVPDLNTNQNFFQLILESAMEKMNEVSEKETERLELINSYSLSIETAENIEELNSLVDDIKNIEDGYTKRILRKKFSIKQKELNNE